MFRSARTQLRAAEAGCMRSLAHAKTNPSMLRTARPLSTVTRQTIKYTPLTAQRRLFSATSTMANTRTESDAFGEVQVANDKYWGPHAASHCARLRYPQGRCCNGQHEVWAGCVIG
jgi:fumarate hydratase class II